MRQLLYIVLVIIVFGFSCSNNNVQDEEISDNQITEPVQEAEIPALPEYVHGICTTDGLRIRRSPDLNSDILGLLQEGQDVVLLSADDVSQTIAGQNGVWLEIELDDYDFSGWVFGAFIEYDAELLHRWKQKRLMHTLDEEVSNVAVSDENAISDPEPMDIEEITIDGE